MSRRVGCVVLAAGASTRLGRAKQLLVHRGRPLVVAAAECACSSRATDRAVVIGAHGAAVRAAVEALPIEVLENPDFGLGVSTSIRVAAEWAEARGCDALIIALCDQPKLTSRHLDCLMVAYERSRLPVGSRYCGKNAVPAIFPRTSFCALKALSGDTGASALLNGKSPVCAVPWPDGEFDVDSPEAQRLLQANGG